LPRSNVVPESCAQQVGSSSTTISQYNCTPRYDSPNAATLVATECETRAGLAGHSPEEVPGDVAVFLTRHFFEEAQTGRTG
jgi:hypothetical protein